MKDQIQYAVAFFGAVLDATVTPDKSRAEHLLEQARVAYGANPDNYSLVEVPAKAPAQIEHKHTPGPWNAVGGVIYAGKRAVARASCLSDLDESDANAALIAQAPALLAQRDALLEACKSALFRLETTGALSSDPLVKELRAALAQKGPI